MSNLLPTTVVIADRTYRIKVEESELETLQQITKLINDKIVEFKTQLAGKDLQDYVSMVLLWFATSQLTSSQNLLEKSKIQQQLQQLESLLDKALTEE